MKETYLTAIAVDENMSDTQTKDKGKKSVWSREACFKRYVEGKSITMIQLSKISGRAIGTIGRWASQDNWKGARYYFQQSLTQDIKDKTILKASEKLSDELSDISLANYQAHKEMRDYVVSIIKRKMAHLAEISYLEYIDWERELKKHHPAGEINNLSMILARSTDCISNAVGLPYHVNVNSAYRKLEAEGYMVVDPNANSDDKDNVDEITIDVQSEREILTTDDV